MAEEAGFEPAWQPSKGWVLPLNDSPTKLADPDGIEPPTPWASTRRSTAELQVRIRLSKTRAHASGMSGASEHWWAREESNLRCLPRGCRVYSAVQSPLWILTQESWSGRWESNPQNRAPEARAYASSATSRKWCRREESNLQHLAPRASAYASSATPTKMVDPAGFEPARPFGPKGLGLLRLPIPPHIH